MNKNKATKLAPFILCYALLCSIALSGCSLMGNTKENYASYVRSLMDTNYKADFTEYIAITGVTEAEAQQVYDDGINYLADALMTAYGINDIEGSDLKEQFEELARQIYSHASYEITSTDKIDGTYQVTVTIYPIDILVITYDDVVAYIEDMNQKVSNGDYNNYELDDYELEYAQGILRVLTDALSRTGNAAGIPVTVTILDNGEYYYISDADFLAIDKAILQTITFNDDGTISTSGEENPSEDTSAADNQ